MARRVRTLFPAAVGPAISKPIPRAARRAHLLVAVPPRRWVALAAILALSAGLNGWWLTREGYSNPYYAATVKSMLTSWHAFFFAAYDPGGFVTVDKPPLGFWIQVVSAKLFGFHGWSLLLPQAVAGVASVALLYHLVGRVFGPPAGLLAALALAVTPINVATNRNNTPDGLLVLTLLLATSAVSHAAETGRLRWLLLGMAVVGLAFNIKMLQAYLVLPAFYLLYLVAAPVRRWQRLAHLALGTVVLLAVSLSWAIAVDLTPPDRRPYVGGSTNNSVLNLALGYNGLNRLLGDLGGVSQAPFPGPQPGPDGPGQSINAAQPTPPGAGSPNLTTLAGENGPPGPLRFFSQQLAGQISWLLPLAGLGLLAAGWQTRLRRPLDRRHQALLLWGMWLLTMLVFFSVAGFWHRYYLVVVAPAIAALAGAGAVALWHDYRRPGRRGWLLPAALVGLAAYQASILAVYPDWSRWLTPLVVAACLLAAGGLVMARRRPRLGGWIRGEPLATVGLLALLLAPAIWAAIPVWNAPGDILPSAGPRPVEEWPMGSSDGHVMRIGLGGLGGTEADPKLVEYLLANRGNARFLVGTESAGGASPLILATGQPVMALGGFGRDRILTADQLARLVADGVVRFFLLLSPLDQPDQALQPPPGQPQRVLGGPGLEDDATRWIRDNCQPVPRELWQSPSTEAGESPDAGSDGSPAPGGLDQTLYDCGREDQ